MRVEYLGLADFLLIAEAVTSIRAEVLVMSADLALADSALNAPVASYGGVEAHPEFPEKVAVLGWHLCRNHPLIDGNKRVAYLAMREFAARNGIEWWPPPADGPDGEETAKVMWDLAAGRLSVEELTAWVADRLGRAP